MTQARTYSKRKASDITSDKPAHPIQAEFTAAHYKFLCENENYRYYPANRLGMIGHAVILTDKKTGKKTAFQYPFPPGDGTAAAPNVVPVTGIEQLERFNNTVYRGKAPDGRVMWAKRMMRGRFNLGKKEEDVDIAYFSPNEKGDQTEPFFGGGHTLPIFKTNISKDEKKDLVKEMKELKERTKGGKEVPVDPESVRVRDENKTRNPQQNQVMGESAVVAYQNFYEQWSSELDDGLREFLKRSKEANIKDPMQSHHRPEWLHAEAFSLTHVKKDPQKEENLGAAPKWANTLMMVLERAAKFFALHRPDVGIKIKPLFTMLLDSELIKHINYELTLEKSSDDHKRFVKFLLDFDIFKRNPMFPKPTDLAQTTGLAHNLLNGVRPISVESIKDIRITPALGVVPAPAIAPPVASLEDLVATPVDEDPELMEPIAKQTSASHPSSAPKKLSAVTKKRVPIEDIVTSEDEIPLVAPSKPAPAAKHHQDERKQASHAQEKQQARKREAEKRLEDIRSPLPKRRANNTLSFDPERHLVKMFTTFFEGNYDDPWNGSTSRSCTGTGFVIQLNGKKYILTNAHVVENHKLVRTKIANHQTKYEVKPLIKSYQCDLALCEVKDEEFQELAVPVEFGEMAKIGDKVLTVGFPMGGKEISVSKGIASRIEVGEYCQSGLEMLLTQVDAAINPGNSGGPVFSDGKVVGVAFQGFNFMQGLKYIIPMPIVNHFLKEAANCIETGTRYRGFPELPITSQTLENQELRKSFHMKPGQTGILVNRINDLCDAFKKLKVGDILLEIDGLPISNHGTVDIEGIGKNINYIHVQHNKFLGDKVTLKVLRHEENKPKIMDIDVILDVTPEETLYVQTEYDKLPTYYISSGICFMPVTMNYITNGRGAELAESVSMEHGCELKDLPKKQPEDELVVVHDILDSKYTIGYEDFPLGTSIVKEINGKKTRNLKDVIKALEENTDPIHTIIAGSKTIRVKNLNKEEHEALFKKYDINFDRSEDLRKVSDMALQRENKEEVRLHPVSKLKPLASKAKPKIDLSDNEKAKKDIDLSSSEASEASEDPKDSIEEISDTFDFRPSRTFSDKLNELSMRYAGKPVAELEEPDFPEEEDEEEDEDDLNGFIVKDADEDKALPASEVELSDHGSPPIKRQRLKKAEEMEEHLVQDARKIRHSGGKSVSSSRFGLFHKDKPVDSRYGKSKRQEIRLNKPKLQFTPVPKVTEQPEPRRSPRKRGL